MSKARGFGSFFGKVRIAHHKNPMSAGNYSKRLGYTVIEPFDYAQGSMTVHALTALAVAISKHLVHIADPTN